MARAETLKLSMPKVQPVQKTATGMSALSICMKDTDRYRYAAFPSHRVPAHNTQTFLLRNDCHQILRMQFKAIEPILRSGGAFASMVVKRRVSATEHCSQASPAKSAPMGTIAFM